MTPREATQELQGKRVKDFSPNIRAFRLSLEQKTLEMFRVSREELLSSLRWQQVTYARFALWYTLNSLLGYSVTELGKLYNRDHSSVIHGIQFVTALLKREAQRANEKQLQANVGSLIYITQNTDIGNPEKL